MWSISPPKVSAEEAFSKCISRVRDESLAQRLSSAKPSIVESAHRYDHAARNKKLHEISTSQIVPPDITVDEMRKVYSQRMVKDDAPGRYIYDKIIASAPGGKCPLCMQRFVSTLDHHLPKTQYPALAVTPLNLVPACFDCNKAKHDAVPLSEEEVPLHPYYDELGEDIWLSATVVESRPSALRFRVERPDVWDDVFYNRVTRSCGQT